MCIDKEKTISTIDSTKNNAVLLTMNNHINKYNWFHLIIKLL